MIVKKFFTLILCSFVWCSVYGEIYRPEFKLFPPPARCISSCKQPCGETFLIIADKMPDFNVVPTEKAAARGYCDRENFYIKVECIDHDIVSEVKSSSVATPGNAGDTVQILLKSEKDPGIWEFNVTANNIVNGFFHYSSGAVIPASSPKIKGFKAEVSCFGTLNKMDDRDTAWRAVVTIPRTIFKNRNLKFTPEENWTILVRRYNYGVHLKAREISSFPQMTIFNLYESDRFARIIFPVK